MKKGVFLLCLAICILFTLSSVCASDVNDTAIASDNADQVIGEVDDDVSSSENEDFLSVADDGTFTSLQKKIDNATSGSEIILENDYAYDKGFKTSGINISKPLTIDGNGHTIDARGKARIFRIASPVTIKNITLINGYCKDDGGAIYGWNSLNLINVHFTGNHSDDSGGAVGNREDLNIPLVLYLKSLVGRFVHRQE